MSNMFNKNGNHLSAKEICLVFGKKEILEVTAEEHADAILDKIGEVVK